MITIKIEVDEGQISEYHFPESWDDVTVEQFARLYTIDKNIHSGMFYSFELLHQLTGIDRDIIEQIDYEDFVILVKKLEFISQPVPENKSESVIVDGEEYFLHSEFNKYTAGEIISIETILGAANMDIHKCMSKLLCVFLRKKKENGNLEKYKTSFMLREEKFKNIKISEINHIFGFFLTGRDSSHNSMKDSSENNQK